MKPIKPVYEKMKNELNEINKDIEIIAVTKQVGIERTQEAIDSGIFHIGENRPEGLLKKQDALGADVKWHYIGNLQTRKVKDVIDKIDFLHSLDRMSLAKEIQKRATRKVDCFVQINVSGEESKSGLDAEEAMEFVEALAVFDKIRVIGLMTMAPNTQDEETIRKVFRGLKALQLQIAEKNWDHAPCLELSMGMSNDYRIAAQEGATFVRIGTSLVGSESEAE